MIRKKPLTPSEFEVLKAVGRAGSVEKAIDPWTLAHLMAADLVADENGRQVLTDQGRAMIVRGSPENWDLAA